MAGGAGASGWLVGPRPETGLRPIPSKFSCISISELLAMLSNQVFVVPQRIHMAIGTLADQAITNQPSISNHQGQFGRALLVAIISPR